MKILIVVILCALLVVATYIFRKAKVRLKKKTRAMEHIILWLPVMEMVIWSAFVWWSVSYLFEGSSVQFAVKFLVITLIFVFVSWYFIRDYIAGIQIKSRFKPAVGHYFKSEQGSGLLRNVGVLLLEIKTENGSYTKVPYSQIDQKTIVLNFEEKSGGEVVFKIVLASKLDERDVKNKISQMILNSPWSSYKSLPRINVSMTDVDHKSYEISCVSTVENGGIKLVEMVKKEFNPLKIQNIPTP